ncbi:MAG: hypothetical protein HRT35_36875, partial [Algicola sp.]|nr:hypothetical protein [Algicola sp.]
MKIKLSCIVLSAYMCLFIGLLHSQIATAQTPLTSTSANPISSLLDAGTHQVGFKLFHVYDKTRSFSPKYHYFGEKTHNPSGRPMQISMWYPAKAAANQTPLSYQDYVGYTVSEVNFNKTSTADQQQFVEQIITSVNKPYQQRLRQMYAQQVNAYKDATMVTGDFPLVLYAPPLNTPSYDNFILCEYLASKGYIVLAVAAKGEYGRTQNPTVKEIHVQADDLAFLLQFGRAQSTSDQVGTIGFSVGGLSNLIFAAKNQDVDATVSLDGSIMSLGWLADIKSSLYYDPPTFSSNLLMIGKNLKDPKLNPATFYDEVSYANKALVRFDHAQHGYFSSDNLLTTLLFDDNMSEKDKQAGYQFYAQMSRYVGDFLDHFLKDGPKLTTRPQKAIAHSFSYQASNANPIPPATISPLILQYGFDYIEPIISDILRIQPDYLTQLSWRDLHDTADQLAKNKQMTGAIKTLLLSARAFEGWYLTHVRLAQYYQRINDTPSAIKHYQLALKDNP